MPGFFVHGYDAEFEGEGTCDRCERVLKGKSAYHVSYDGVVAKHRICAGCLSHLRQAFGITEAGGGPGKPTVG